MKNVWLIGLLSVSLLNFGCSSSSEEDNFQVLGSAAGPSDTRIAVRNQAPTLAGSPTSFNITLYGLWLSENEDCSDPIQAADFGSSGEEFDLFTDPTILSTTVPEGTYPCLIIQFKDVMTFSADEEAVAAHAGCEDTTTEYAFDVYRGGEDDDGDWVDVDGDAIDATGSAAAPGNDRPFSFSSTASDPSIIEANGVPVHTNQIGVLTSPLIVPGQTTFFWNAADGLANHDEGGSDFCWVEQSESGFY